ncbi:MAG TPA: arginine--tRNA ligase [Desulfosalsimonadaceae bacterium]|nr:arginine--tRNA ligase [Desulfosalsimonadaceae bacterium]
MKTKLKTMIKSAAEAAYKSGALNSDEFAPVEIEEPKAGAHGDLASNFAMLNAAGQKMAPRKIAESVVSHISDPEGIIEKTEIAGPGFINFFISKTAWHPVLHDIHAQNGHYGACDIGKGQKVQVEFVSANPTGPLHVGHGRGAVVGDTVAAILAFCGYDMFREYYINDSGKQIQTLGRSVYLRCLELAGQNINFPEDCYQGDYIYDIAKDLMEQKGDWLTSAPEEETLAYCAQYAAATILKGIRDDLALLGIRFDHWFSEQGLYDTDKVAAAIKQFQDEGLIYEKEGALWFKTESFGDEKDRVVVRQNGQTTYFASDIAYHKDKFDRGFDQLIDVWGADHHGYIPRISAAIKAAGKNDGQFHVILTQLVNLLRGGTPVAMSTRAGQFVTLREVIDEVGRDAVRFIFLTRHYESQLDFDLEVAKQKTNDNPVYYVQYVHARISSIFKKAKEEKGIASVTGDTASVSRLTEPEEIALIKHMARYPEIIQTAAQWTEPHRIAFYLMELAAAFHAYYNKHRVLIDDPQLADGRLYLVRAVQKIIRNGLGLLGVSAPDTM